MILACFKSPPLATPEWVKIWGRGSPKRSTGNMGEVPHPHSWAITRLLALMGNPCSAQGWGMSRCQVGKRCLKLAEDLPPQQGCSISIVLQGNRARPAHRVASLWSSILSMGTFELGFLNLAERYSKMLATASFPGNWYIDAARRINRTLNDLKGHWAFRKTARQVPQHSTCREGMALYQASLGVVNLWVEGVISMPGTPETLINADCLWLELIGPCEYFHC